MSSKFDIWYSLHTTWSARTWIQPLFLPSHLLGPISNVSFYWSIKTLNSNFVFLLLLLDKRVILNVIIITIVSVSHWPKTWQYILKYNKFTKIWFCFCWIFEIISMYILTVEARLNCVPLFLLCSLWLPNVEIALHLVISLTLSFPLHFRKKRETFSSFLKLTVGSDLPIFTMMDRTCSTSQSTTILSRVQFRSRALYLQNWHFFLLWNKYIYSLEANSVLIYFHQ